MIGVAIIGTGAISDSHIEAYLQFPNRCKIVALADVNARKAEEKIQRHGLAAVALADAAALLRMPEVDLVSVCLPPSLHCAVSVEMLRGGKHVLCEKPLAPTLEECDQMLRAAKESGRLLSAVAQNRFKPDVAKARRLVESGLLGRMLCVQASSLWWRGENYYNLSWRGRWETEGGGCTLIHGIHHIDLMLWMAGEVQSVTARTANQAHANSEVEDVSLSLVTFKSGAVGTVMSSLLHHKEEQRLLLDAERGSLELPLRVSASKQLENGFPEPDEAALASMQAILDGAESLYTGHTGQIDDVLASIETGRAPLVDGTDGRRAIEFISAVYQSAFTGKTVTLPMTPADAFYTREGILKGAARYHEKTVSVEGFQNDAIQVGGTL